MFCFITHITLEVLAAVKIYIVVFLSDRWVRTTWRNILFPSSPRHAKKVAVYTEDRGEGAVENRTDRSDPRMGKTDTD
jgi:hypothetical protein